MSELNIASRETDQQQINPNQDIQTLVGNVDISSFEEKLTPILANPDTKELLIKELKENQPLTGRLMMRRIIDKVRLKLIETKDEKNEAKIEEIQNGAKEKIEKAKLAVSEVSSTFSAFEKSSIPANKKTEISSRISSQLADIKNGKIPDETKNFLNTIGANTPESIASPEVQSILTAHISTRVYLENKDSILKTNPELGEQFNTLEVNAPTLGVPRSTPASGVTKLLGDIPKSDREAITSTVNSLTKGSPDTMITRTGDRLTFHDPKNERYSYDIDMAKRPPQLSKSLSGLSISREIVSLSREDQEKSDKKTQAEKQLKSSQDTLSQSKNEFWQIRRDEYAMKGENKADGTEGVNLYSQYIGENRGDHARYETLEQAYAQGEVADKDKVSILEQMRSISLNMYRENLSKGSKEDIVSMNRNEIGEMLDKRIRKLSILKESEESLARVDKKALEYTPVGGGSEQWEKDASDSLSFLSELGLNDLKQQGFEDVMEAYNEKKKDSSKHQIHLSENPKIDDIQRKEFREMIDKFTGGSNIRNKAFVDLLNNLTSDKFRENNWNTKEKRAEYLFGDKKQNPVPQNT